MPGAGRRNPKAGTGAGAGAGSSHQTAGYDGPGEASSSGKGSRGRAPTDEPSTGSRAGSRGPAVTHGQDDKPIVLSRNVDFGGNAYNLNSSMPTQLMMRGRFGTLGKPQQIDVNSHVVVKFPTRDIFQYDVLIGSSEEKRGLIKAVSESATFKKAVGDNFIFDGNKIGWSLTNFQKPLSFMIDMDAEKGKPSRPDAQGLKRNEHRVRINKASNDRIRLYAIESYLRGESEFSSSVLEAINFLDHLLRATPSKKHVNLRRSYFAHAPSEVFQLGGGVNAIKGVYQSLRAVEGSKLVVNVDVSNAVFWHQSVLTQLAYQLNNEPSSQAFERAMQIGPGGELPVMYAFLKRLNKNKILVRHNGRSENDNCIFTIKAISKFNAKTYKFSVKEKATGKETTTSLYDYFLKKYEVHIQHWRFPLIETTKPGVLFPMELCWMTSGQRYPFKLNEDQTSKMIKFAATRPPVRKQAIDEGLKLLDWANDPILRNYGLQINPQMLQTKARLLDPPSVGYAKGGVAQPGYSGRWDLRGKVFFQPNPAELAAWGVCVIAQGSDGRPPVRLPAVKAFVEKFVKIYRGHGGRVLNPEPPIIEGIPDVAKAIEKTYNTAAIMDPKTKTRQFPQILLVVLPNKNADTYYRVKKNCELRYGIVSQCCLSSHVLKNQDQYISNVLMKFNCKLGGTTCVIAEKNPTFKRPTMIIGADVSHPAPGAAMASIAAVSVSMDRQAARYLAGVQTNGYRVEMITPANLEQLLKPLIQRFMTTVNGGRVPQHVYYFRDGVSEGQFRALLANEVADIKRIFEQLAPNDPLPQFTVVVAEKRHHIRFFPKAGSFAADKNGNPKPGVLVDKDVTHPFENDIYLCSHAAIQGTARPTHYQILMDEANVPPDVFQQLVYTHCYQYQRATTPVSLFPAIYYAHHAAARGVGRINKERTDQWLADREAARRQGQPASSSERSLTEAPPLVPYQGQKPNGTMYDMWYI